MIGTLVFKARWLIWLAPAVVAVAIVGGPRSVSADPPLDEGARDFLELARVLQSPRCMNCHPKGDAPLQGDIGIPHAMNVSRASNDAGLACNACHRLTNSPVRGGPPGAPNWKLPPRATPMIFEGRTPAALCAQLKDPAQNGRRSLDALLEHIAHDPLVAWGWAPGTNRTTPPLSHDETIAHTKRWIRAGAPCPP